MNLGKPALKLDVGPVEIHRRRLLQMLGAAGLVAPALLGGARLDAAQVEGPLRLLTEDTDDPEIAWYQEVNAEFAAAHPDLALNYDAVGMSGLFERLTTALAANDPPDLVSGSGLSRVATLANLGVLDSVDDILDEIGREDFMPGMIDTFTFDGAAVAVPVQTLSFLYWYREDLAGQAGVKAPTSWDELLTLSQALTAGDMYGIVLPLGINTATARQVLCYIRQNGGNIVDESGAVALDSAKNRETLAFLKELYQYSPPGSAGYGFGDLLTNYTAGTGAGTYYAGRMLGRVHSNAPDLEPVTGGIRQPHNGTPFCYTEPRGAYILAGARNRDAAKAWLLECLFERAHHIEWLLTAPGHNLPVRTSIAEDPDYRDFPLLDQHADILATLLSETQFGGNFYKESPDHKPNLQGGALDTGPILPTMLQRYLINGESEEAALAWGQRQVVDLMRDA